MSDIQDGSQSSDAEGTNPENISIHEINEDELEDEEEKM